MSRLIVIGALLAVVAAGSGSPAPPGAADYYLKIEGIEGDAEDGAIAVAGAAWNTVAAMGRFDVTPPAGLAVSDPGAGGSKPAAREIQTPRDRPSGMATGRRQHSPFTIVKPLDKATPKLMEACVDGDLLPDVEVWSSEGGQAQLRYTLKDAIITSYSVSRDPDPSARPIESITFSYERMEVRGSSMR